MTWFRKISLTHWILISMVVGMLVGWSFPDKDYPQLSENLKVVSNLFLRMIKCILVPLVFSTLVVGIASHSDDLKAVGRLALKAFIYFEAVTTVALVIGLVAVNLTRPGVGVSLPPEDASQQVSAAKVTLQSIIEHLVPTSFFDAAAKNDVLQVVFFAIIFGIALAQVTGKPRESVLSFMEGLMEAMFKFTGLVM